jgi:hypothetical protein
MSTIGVKNILKLIDGLSPRERELLDEQLSLRADAQWRREAEEARREASKRDINQATIDEAVRQVRYGS